MNLVGPRDEELNLEAVLAAAASPDLPPPVSGAMENDR
jgi:hypothetical protein